MFMVVLNKPKPTKSIVDECEWWIHTKNLVNVNDMIAIGKAMIWYVYSPVTMVYDT